MTLERVLPPHVKGKLQGHLTVKVDEIFWIHAVPGEVIVELQWWGDSTSHIFRPEVINNVKAQCKEEDTKVIFNIRTSPLLFEAYLKKCDKLFFRVLRPLGETLGGATVSNLARAVLDGPRSGEYYPVYDENGSRIGDLNIAFELWLLRKNEDTERRKLPSEKLLAMPNEKKCRLPADKEQLVARAVDCGERLRDAMTMSVLEDAPVESVERALDPTHPVSRPTAEADIVNYLLSEKDLSVEEEADAIRSLQGITSRKASSQQCCGQFCGHSTRSEGASNSPRIGGQSERPATSDSSTLRNALDLVNCYRLLVHCLHLSPLGVKKVSCVEKKDTAGKKKGPPGVCYMIEMLPPITKKPTKPWNAAVHRFVSRKMDDNKVLFNDSGAVSGKVARGKAWDDVTVSLDGARFRVYWRFLNQRLPSLLGIATINSADIKTGGVLSTFIVPVTTNSGGVSGHLSFVIELGKDKKTFGPHLMYCDGSRMGGSGSRWSDCECRCCRLVCGERGTAPPSVAGVVCRPLSAPAPPSVPPHRARAFQAMRSASATSYGTNGDTNGFAPESVVGNERPNQPSRQFASSSGRTTGGSQSVEPVVKTTQTSDHQLKSSQPPAHPTKDDREPMSKEVGTQEGGEVTLPRTESIRNVKDAVVQVNRIMTDTAQQTTPETGSLRHSPCIPEVTRLQELPQCRACMERHTCSRTYEPPCYPLEGRRMGSHIWTGDFDRFARSSWDHWQCCCCSPVRPTSAPVTTPAVRHEIVLRVDSVRGFPLLDDVPPEDVDCFVDYIFPTVLGDGLAMPGIKYSTEVSVVPGGGRDVAFGREFVHTLTLPADISLTRALARLPLPGIDFNLWARTYRGSTPRDTLVAKGILNIGQLGSMEMEFLKEGRRSPVRERMVLPLVAMGSTRNNPITGDIILTARYRSTGGDRPSSEEWVEPSSTFGEINHLNNLSRNDLRRPVISQDGRGDFARSNQEVEDLIRRGLRSGPGGEGVDFRGRNPDNIASSRVYQEYTESRRAFKARNERDPDRRRLEKQRSLEELYSSDDFDRGTQERTSPTRERRRPTDLEDISQKKDRLHKERRDGVEKLRSKYSKCGEADVLQLIHPAGDDHRVRKTRDQALSPITETSLPSPRGPAWIDTDSSSDKVQSRPQAPPPQQKPTPAPESSDLDSPRTPCPRRNDEPPSRIETPASMQYPEAKGEHFKAKVEIERAINLPPLEGATSCYAAFEAAIGGRRRPVVTNAVSDIINPVWNASFEVSLPVQYLYKVGGGLQVKVVRGGFLNHNQLPGMQDVGGSKRETSGLAGRNIADHNLPGGCAKLPGSVLPAGADLKTVIDVAALAAGFPALLGWFPLLQDPTLCNPTPTVKLKITPLEDVSRFKPLWAKEYSQWKLSKSAGGTRRAPQNVEKRPEMSPASQALLDKVLALEKMTAGLKAEIHGKKQPSTSGSSPNLDLIDLTASPRNHSHVAKEPTRPVTSPTLERHYGLFDPSREPQNYSQALGLERPLGRIDPEIAAMEARYGGDTASATLNTAHQAAGFYGAGYSNRETHGPSRTDYTSGKGGFATGDYNCPGGYTATGYNSSMMAGCVGVSYDSSTDSPRNQPGMPQSSVSISSREEDSLDRLMRPAMVDRTANTDIPFCTDEEFERLQAEFLNTPASEINRIIRGLENL